MLINSKTNSIYIVLIGLGIVASVLTGSLLVKTSANALYFCQQIISNTLLKIPHSLPGAMALAGWVTVSLGIVSLGVQLTKTFLLIKKVSGKKIKSTQRLSKIVKSLHLEDKIQLVHDSNLYSFCFGLFNPQIVITTGLVDSLSAKELEAVLLHEQVHLQNRDPLKILLGKTITSMFFFLPIFNELYKSMEAKNELIADQLTIQIQKDSKYLRSALRKIIAKPQVNFSMVSAISHPDYIEIRVKRLVDSNTKVKVHVSYISIVTGIFFVAVNLLALRTPVNAFHTEMSTEPSYFVCSADSACNQECQHNSQTKNHEVSDFSSEQLFSSQPSKYEAPSYK